MSGAGAERPATGLAAEGRAEDESGQWAVDRRIDGGWQELQRLGSEEKAQEALDETAARDGIALEDLRVRRVET